MKLLPSIVRPFNEVAARLMTLGYYSDTCSQPFPGWKINADRFGVNPRTVEAYLAAPPPGSQRRSAGRADDGTLLAEPRITPLIAARLPLDCARRAQGLRRHPPIDPDEKTK
jgi:hypothetical protein